MSASVVLTQPEPARTPTAPAGINPIDDFFGAPTSESRHDRRISISDSQIEPPPDYVNPPEYTRKAEPITLAMYLFKFGFLFPPFWILGAAILLSPLRAPSAEPAAWLPEKTEAEKQALISHLRKSEKKWAWRCLIALIILTVFAVALGVTVAAILQVKRS